MEHKNYCVYKHTGPTGLIYIGITKQSPENRWKNGKGYSHNPRFANAIKKYGWDSFEHEILKDGLIKEEAENLEVSLIKQYGTMDKKKGYNIAAGGYANSPSEETKEKIKQSIRGIWKDPTKRADMVNNMRGVKRSEASRKNISKAQRKRFEKPEERLAVSERQKGRVRSVEARQKTSESLKQYYKDEDNKKRLVEVRRKRRNRAKPVVCIETGEVFNAVIDAERKYSIGHQNIVKVCRGERTRAGGYTWKYAEE